MSGSEHKSETHLQILSDSMIKRDGIPPEARTDQVLTTAVASDGEKKSDSASMEKLDAQSISYRRSRNVALMKLALLRPENDEAA